MLKTNFKNITKFAIYFWAVFLLLFAQWLSKKFGNPNFEQILYHMQFGKGGLVDADPSMIRSFFVHVVFKAAAYSAALYWLNVYIVNKRLELRIHALKTRRLNRAVSIGVAFVQFTNSIFYWIFKKKFPIVLLVFAASVLLTKISFWQYVQGLEYQQFIEETYVAPEVIVEPQEKRNLVLIYAESLEKTYENKSIFEEDLLEPLKEAVAEGVSFDRYTQTPGTGWTIAGIVSTQCGIPLRPITLFDGNVSGEKIDAYLPGVVCLGDILKAAGYRNVFMGGASPAFSGKGKFLSAHGYSEIYGKEYWQAHGSTKFNDWGIYDDELLQNARLKFDKLIAQGKPFNLTVLTVETHHPDGYISPTCASKGVNDFEGIVKCATSEIAEFVNYVKKSKAAKNTDIVIVGDHLAMANAVYDRLPPENERSIYNRFISIKNLDKNRSEIYHYDLFPSILFLLGFEFPENKLALGVSGFGALPSGYVSDDQAVFSNKLIAPSKKYSEFWNANKLDLVERFRLVRKSQKNKMSQPQ